MFQKVNKGFGKKWGWENEEIIFIFEWTKPLILLWWTEVSISYKDIKIQER